MSGNGIEARCDVLQSEQVPVLKERAKRDGLGVEAHRVRVEFAGPGSGIVVAVGERAASLQRVSLLGQEPGFGERGRGDGDVPHAAGIEEVVDTLGDQGVKLDHHRLDRLLVALEEVDRAGTLLGRGVQPLCARPAPERFVLPPGPWP